MSKMLENKKQLLLRAQSLKPVVYIGQNGLTDAVYDAIDEALLAHALIKIKIQAENRMERKELIQAIIKSCDATLIQSVGHVAVIYRENATE